MSHLLTKLRKRLVMLVLMLPMMAVFADETKAATLQISGIISAKFYKDPSTFNTTSNWFLVTIDGNNARIKAGPMGDYSISDFEYGTLGDDSYLLINYVTNLLITETIQMRDDRATKIKLATPQKSFNAATIFLNNGRSPEYSFGLLSPVWMAYCFNLDLKNHETNRLQAPPVFSMGASFREQGGLADIAYTLNSQPPYFLQTMIESGDFKQFEELKLPSPFHGVFTNGIYEVLQWTNVAGFAVAQRFQAVNNFVVTLSGVHQDGAKIVYDGTATDIVLDATPPPAFNIPKVTAVIERRSTIITPLVEFGYVATNGILMSREKLLQNEAYRNELSERSDVPESTELSNNSYLKRRVVIYIIFGTLAVLPFAMLWFARKK